MNLTPAGELAAKTIASCSTCRGEHWCPSCEDRRDALATAVEAIVARHVAVALKTAAMHIEYKARVMELHGTLLDRLLRPSWRAVYRDAAHIVRNLAPPP